MRDELYIDGERVDMGKSGVSLEYRSNILTDVGKIVSNFSYTIRLPKTKNNLRLIGCAHMPSSTSGFPYLPHVGSLVRDGVQVVDNADIVLLSVSDSIEVALSWGNAVGLTRINEFDGSLNELDYKTDEYVMWKKGVQPSIQFPLIRYGFKDSEVGVTYHPAVSARWIFDKIQDQFGITFVFPKSKKDALERIIIPLLSRDDSEKNIEANTLSLYMNGIDTKRWDALHNRNTFLYSSASSSEYVHQEQEQGQLGVSIFKPSCKGLEAECSFTATLQTKGVNYMRVKVIASNTGEVLEEIDPREEEDKGGGVRGFTFEKELSFNPYEKPFKIICDTRIVGSITSFFGTLSITAKASEVSAEDGAYNKFFLTPNLPKIKPMEFIKAITGMLGVFAFPEAGNVIRFVSFDDVIANKAKAYDWSDFVVFKDYGEAARSISFQLNDFTQRNWCRYKDDDKVKGNYDAYIEVENKALKVERDMIKLPFAGCDTLGGVASIPLYSYDDEGKMDYEGGASPRVVWYDGATQSGTFYPLHWSELLKANYGMYMEFVRKPKTLKEQVRLPVPYLASLDLLRPVYIRQYGSYFAIVSVKTKGDNICEVELLKI